ncbi:MAG: metalloregulator ArsR/SmtB family transcription factor [Oscillospiraceae bacterium]|jgi:ArsR family transcriptional regulator|nr:metalloregulator ArsR/SmtB family transcription factor [Oscillospiraceae bacterium]
MYSENAGLSGVSENAPALCDCFSRAVAEPEDELRLYELAELFKVFGDSTRVRILCALLQGEACVNHLAERLGMGQSAVSHQLRLLRTAGLVRPRRDGKTIYYALDDDHVKCILQIGLTHLAHKH